MGLELTLEDDIEIPISAFISRAEEERSVVNGAGAAAGVAVVGSAIVSLIVAGSLS